MRTSLSVVILAFASTALHAGEPMTADSGKGVGKEIVIDEALDQWGGPILGAGIKTNFELTEGSLFMVQPLVNTIGNGSTMEGDVLFLEPYGSWAEGGEIGLSLGLGYRHLFSNQSVSAARAGGPVGLLTEGVFVGANTFLDYAQSIYDNDFWQGGIGVEAGTRYIELRANYYIPFSDDVTIRERTETDVHRSVHSSTGTVAGAPFTNAAGQIVQNVSRVKSTRTRTTVTKTAYELFEEPLEGFDIELGLLLPYIDEFCEVKLVGGYYDLSGERSRQSDVSGWRAGVEVRPIPALVFHATWFEDDRLYRDNWLTGVRMELPLGDDSALKPRRRHLAERLFEPVHRKNSSVTSTGVEEEQTSSTTTTTTNTTTTTTGQGTNVIGNVPPPDDCENEHPPK